MSQRVVRRMAELLVGVATVASAVFWHTSAVLQERSVDTTGKATLAVVRHEAEANVQAWTGKANAFAQDSAVNNLFAAVCAVVARIGGVLSSRASRSKEESKTDAAAPV